MDDLETRCLEHQKRLGRLEVSMGKLETELPYITKAVDKIDTSLTGFRNWFIAIMGTFIVGIVLLLVKFFISEIGGST